MAIDQITYLAPSVFAFYMIVSANFLPELLGCRMQDVLRTNMYAKHFTGFVLLFFLVVLVNPSFSSSDSLWKLVLASTAIYLWFLVTTRAPFSIACVTILLMLATYIINIRKDQMTDANKDNAKPEDIAYIKRMETIQYALIVASLVISVAGFGVYAVEKYREYGKKFNLLKFIFGTKKCRNFTPERALILSS
jgi:hypothetical protein